ncbi:hypothetical protein K3495_g7274 [Podosphaera aphanis]|nr:hypothetical protein K3495_g7274 [Podosphaera aphanis]
MSLGVARIGGPSSRQQVKIWFGGTPDFESCRVIVLREVFKRRAVGWPLRSEDGSWL